MSETIRKRCFYWAKAHDHFQNILIGPMPKKILHKSYRADVQGFNLIVSADAHQSSPDCEHQIVLTIWSFDHY